MADGLKLNAKLNAWSQKQIADLFGVSGTAVRQWGDQGCPRNKDRSYCPADVVKWWRHRYEQALESSADGGCPELRRMRAASADLREFELSVRRREHVPLSGMRTAWDSIACRIRAAGEVLQRDYGRPAAQVLDDAIDDAVELATRHFGNLGDPCAASGVEDRRDES